MTINSRTVDCVDPLADGRDEDAVPLSRYGLDVEAGSMSGEIEERRPPCEAASFPLDADTNGEPGGDTREGELVYPTRPY